MTDHDGLGPAMRALDDRHRAFVMELLNQEKLDQGKAAEAAGFCPIETSTSKNRVNLLRKTGSVLAHKPAVQAALLEAGGKELVSLALPAVRAMKALLSDPAAKGHRNAAESVLDRVGLGATQNISVKHEHTDRTGAALMDRIRELAAKHGLDPARLLAGETPQPRVIEHVDVGGGLGAGQPDGSVEFDVEVGAGRSSGGGCEAG